jgi:uncharacterized membrane protein
MSAPQRRSDDAGSVTAFVAAFTVALLAVAGLVVDGGYLLAGRRAAFDEAEAAARAGAQAVDADVLRLGGPVTLRPDEARRLVAAYLSRTGHEGSVEVSGDAVTVRVRIPQRLTILGLLGVGPLVVEGSGTAHGVQAVGDQEGL